jgi:hypothetical protein
MMRKIAVFTLVAGLMLVAGLALHTADVYAGSSPDWSQWGRTAQHESSTRAVGQSPSSQLANLTVDPFVAQEQAESTGDLLAHYQVPLLDGNHVFIESKSGTYTSCVPPGSGKPYPCGPDAWNNEIWNEQAYVWQNGALVETWNFQSDWKPEPNTDVGGQKQDGLGGWEPVFHPALWNGYLFVPGFGGTIYKVDEATGAEVAQYNPNGSTINPNSYVSGPLTVDQNGNIYYNELTLNPTNPWSFDIRGAFLVKVTASGSVSTVSYSVLVKDPPPRCIDHLHCGAQRPGINVAPAVSGDGSTIYTVSRAHFFPNWAYLIAVNSDLTPKWQTSMRTLVDHSISGEILDEASATPVVAPDGNVIFGVVGPDAGRGYLLKFNSSGKFLGSYDFGWDDTPAVYSHDGTYSVITKDNHYGSGGPYYITQLNAGFGVEWQYQSTTNYEWCVNAPAVDKNGTVYADSEDGNVYVINQGGTLKGNLFLQDAVGAAYTPIAIGNDGKIYTLNDGNMFVVGDATAK